MQTHGHVSKKPVKPTQKKRPEQRPAFRMSLMFLCPLHHLYVPAQGFEPYPAGLYHGNGNIPRFAGVNIGYFARFTFVCAGNYFALITVFEVQLFGRADTDGLFHGWLI